MTERQRLIRHDCSRIETQTPGAKTMYTDKSSTFRSFISGICAISLSLLMAASFVHSTDFVQWMGSDAVTNSTITAQAHTVGHKALVRYV
jgi:hypothetical protein